jgi:hypothetical protein
MPLRSFLRRWFGRHTARLDRRRAARLRVERLEEREVPAGLPSGVAVFQPQAAAWYMHSSPGPGAPDVAPFAYGGANWIPVAGDWNGDGQVSAGVYDPTTATWYLKNDNGPGAPSVTPFRYGAPGWIPVVGDWNGHGRTGIGVYDPATATFYLRNETNAGAPDAGQFRYGAPGWLPVVGDWDSNGTTTVGVFDPGFASFYLRNENSAGAFSYGMRGWLPVAGDWDGNGTTTVGVYDPRWATWYLKNSNTPGAPDIAPFAYGAPGWDPVALNAPAPPSLNIEANVGQTDGQARYLANVSGGTAFFTEQGLVLSASGSTTGANGQPTPTTVAERVRFAGGNPNPVITAEGQQAGVVNYFIGNDPSQWHVGVTSYPKSRVGRKEPHNSLGFTAPCQVGNRHPAGAVAGRRGVFTSL